MSAARSMSSVELLVAFTAASKRSAGVPLEEAALVTLTALSQSVDGSAMALDLAKSLAFSTCSCTGSRFQTFERLALDLLVPLSAGARAEHVAGGEPDDESNLAFHGRLLTLDGWCIVPG